MVDTDEAVLTERTWMAETDHSECAGKPTVGRGNSVMLRSES
jgi:hypothetical protein